MRRSEFKAYLGHSTFIDVDRSKILESVLMAYRKHPELVHTSVQVSFKDEAGVDTDGLKREMYHLFFSQIATEYCSQGGTQKIFTLDHR